MYRPQFAFPESSGPCQEQRCTYSYDRTNTPALAGTLAAGATTPRIPFLLDRDADYLWRAIQVSPTVLLVGIEDPGGHPIVHANPSSNPPVELNALWAQCDGGPFVTLDSDNWGIYCGPGAVLIGYVSNPTAGALVLPIITFHGIKRFRGNKCR